MAAVSKAPTMSASATRGASSSPCIVPWHSPSCASTSARPSSVADWLSSAAKAARTLGAQVGPAPPSGEAARVTTCAWDDTKGIQREESRLSDPGAVPQQGNHLHQPWGCRQPAFYSALTAAPLRTSQKVVGSHPCPSTRMDRSGALDARAAVTTCG